MMASATMQCPVRRSRHAIAPTLNTPLPQTATKQDRPRLTRCHANFMPLPQESHSGDWSLAPVVRKFTLNLAKKIPAWRTCCFNQDLYSQRSTCLARLAGCRLRLR